MSRPEYMIFIFIIGLIMVSIGLISLRKNLDEEDESFEEKYLEDEEFNDKEKE